MNNKPPVPVKSDRVKNLARPRRTAPPKPLPYIVHREITRKPDPPPRRNARQGNIVSTYNQDETGTRGFVEIIDRGGRVEDVSSSGPQGQNLRPSPPNSGGITSRPRLDTPVSPPDPGMAPRNGIRSPAIPQAKAASAVTPARTHPSQTAETNGRISPPPAVHKSSNLVGQTATGVVQEPYTEVFASVGDTPEDSYLYSTVVDAPRKILTPTPPPTPLSRSNTPPAPAHRSPLPPSSALPTNSSEQYNVTVHAGVKTQPPLYPDPTPLDTYSALARPDQPNKVLNPTPPPGDAEQAYSVLNAEEIHHTVCVISSLKDVYAHVHVQKALATPYTCTCKLVMEEELNPGPIYTLHLNSVNTYSTCNA